MPTTSELDALLSPAIEAAMREMLVPGAVVHARPGARRRAPGPTGTATSAGRIR